MAKQALGLELKQQQKLSPLQIQTIKLIELPVQELEQRIRKELEENPVLDEDNAPRDESKEEEEQPKDISIDEYKEIDDIPSYKLKVNNFGKDERPQYNTFSVRESFSQSLRDQLGFRDVTDHQRQVAEFLIGSLDEDGYLRRSIDSLVDDMAFRAGIDTDEDEVLQMLKLIQEFEPTGVGARSLQECLSLQLAAKSPTPENLLAKRIVDEYFQEFSNRHFQKIIGKLGIGEDEFKDALSRITKLNPSPGGQIDDSYNDEAQQIIPDFVLDYSNGEMHLSMPRFSIPELRINRKYADMLMDAAGSGSTREQREAATFVKRKIDSAKWFVEAIKQRHNTLESTMKAILEYQHDYFVDGDESCLRPMVLKDIAEKTGFDISTISRVVNSKYIETHFGIYPLKYFFSEGLENQDGNEVSTRELKKALREIVESEDTRNPFTDDQLVQEMEKRGYKVARRTVAKYRDLLNIPKARLRRTL